MIMQSLNSFDVTKTLQAGSKKILPVNRMRELRRRTITSIEIEHEDLEALVKVITFLCDVIIYLIIHIIGVFFGLCIF